MFGATTFESVSFQNNESQKHRTKAADRASALNDLIKGFCETVKEFGYELPSQITVDTSVIAPKKTSAYFKNHRRFITDLYTFYSPESFLPHIRPNPEETKGEYTIVGYVREILYNIDYFKKIDKSEYSQEQQQELEALEHTLEKLIENPFNRLHNLAQIYPELHHAIRTLYPTLEGFRNLVLGSVEPFSKEFFLQKFIDQIFIVTAVDAQNQDEYYSYEQQLLEHADLTDIRAIIRESNISELHAMAAKLHKINREEEILKLNSHVREVFVSIDKTQVRRAQLRNELRVARAHRYAAKAREREVESLALDTPEAIYFRRQLEVVLEKTSITSTKVREFFYDIEHSRWGELSALIQMPNDKGEILNYKLGTEEQQTLIVSNLVDFLKKLSQVDSALEQSQNKWYAEQTLPRLWRNATWLDFQQPIQYLDSILAQIELGSLNYPFELQHDRNDFKECGVVLADTGDELMVKETQAGPDYESPHDLETYIGKPEEYSRSKLLHTVRYSRYKPEGVTIFAVQMPRFSNIPKKEEHEYKMDIERFDIMRKVTDIIGAIKRNSRLLRMIEITLGTFELDKVYPQTLASVIETLGGIERALSTHKEGSKEYEQILDVIGFASTRYKQFKEKESFYDDREKNLSRFNQLLKYQSEPTNTGELMGSKSLRSIPPAALISLTAALAIMYENGVREVRLPIYLPLRPRGDETDSRIQKQTLAIMYRAVHELEGFELKETTEDAAEIGYVYFTLTQLPEAKNPLLAKVIQLISAGY